MAALRYLLFTIFSLSLLAGAQKPPPDDPNYMAQGRLLILRVVPGDKSVKLFFAGTKAAELDLKKDHTLLSVTASGKKKSEILKFKETGEAYEVSTLPTWKEPYELSVKSSIRGQVEELKVKMPATKP
jgi:hypothetical protein